MDSRPNGKFKIKLRLPAKTESKETSDITTNCMCFERSFNLNFEIKIYYARPHDKLVNFHF